ncbi:hypothetical protein P375_11405 [Gallibacterium genomosp. 2]|uniref:Uncharacterized protein n=1 Tax=Gallibacterium genomosp. 2 TaxID=155517 RepID=A0A0A2XG59_9PAST|nr:hypothetical protein [Gallibacterium genomosp. 2]KGQ30007.1 hypothetical protein P375_11405 [Gallibacterium genomosp. 2]
MGKLSLDDIKTTLDNSKLDDSKKNSRIGSFPPDEDDYNRSPQEQKLLEDIENLKANRAMRKEYAEKAYDFAKNTIAFWAFLFFIYFLFPPDKKPLSEMI